VDLSLIEFTFEIIFHHKQNLVFVIVLVIHACYNISKNLYLKIKNYKITKILLILRNKFIEFIFVINLIK